MVPCGERLLMVLFAWSQFSVYVWVGRGPAVVPFFLLVAFLEIYSGTFAWSCGCCARGWPRRAERGGVGLAPKPSSGLGKAVSLQKAAVKRFSWSNDYFC